MTDPLDMYDDEVDTVVVNNFGRSCRLFLGDDIVGLVGGGDV